MLDLSELLKTSGLPAPGKNVGFTFVEHGGYEVVLYRTEAGVGAFSRGEGDPRFERLEVGFPADCEIAELVPAIGSSHVAFMARGPSRRSGSPIVGRDTWVRVVDLVSRESYELLGDPDAPKWVVKLIGPASNGFFAVTLEMVETIKDGRTHFIARYQLIKVSLPSFNIDELNDRIGALWASANQSRG
ncbi:MAG: hypothetical protein GQE15_13770 [Archangiaceae bacterium]|nr:hypothetical protein [Archangiaceae bacterium]